VKIEFNEIGMLEIETFYNQLVEDISSYTDDVYTLDFLEVEMITLPAIQVLLSFKKHCNKKNIELESINIHSDHILQAIETYNLKKTLGVKS